MESHDTPSVGANPHISIGSHCDGLNIVCYQGRVVGFPGYPLASVKREFDAKAQYDRIRAIKDLEPDEYKFQRGQFTEDFADTYYGNLAEEEIAEEEKKEDQETGDDEVQ